MKTKGKAWQLVVTVLLIAAFVYTAFFGVAVKYGDVTKTYIKGAQDIRFGVDIKGGVNVTFAPSDNYDATDDQLDAAQLVIENRLVGLTVTDYELYVDYDSDRLILEFPWQSGVSTLAYSHACSCRACRETSVFSSMVLFGRVTACSANAYGYCASSALYTSSASTLSSRKATPFPPFSASCRSRSAA